jgi:chromosome segregation ATPase
MSSTEPILRQLLQEIQSLKVQLNTTEQQHTTEREQFQTELNQLAAQQQQLLNIINTAESNKFQILESLKQQEQYLQEHHQQQQIIRKNQLAISENLNQQYNHLKEGLNALRRSSGPSSSLLQLVRNSEPIELAKLVLGLFLVNLVSSLILLYFPGGINQTLKLLDSKVALLWQEQKDIQKFLGVPQRN